MDLKSDYALLDGFAGDRKIRPANTFQLDISAPNRNFINIWLPECVSCDTGMLSFMPWGEDRIVWKNDGDNRTCSRSDISSQLRIESVAEEVDFGVKLEMRLSNTSEAVLRDVTVHSCIQLAAAPDFRDPGLERTFWRSNGQWARFKVTSEVQDGRCIFYGHEGHPDIPLIVVESAVSSFAAGLVFRGATELGGNCQQYICCIHSLMPAFDIECGNSIVIEGRLFIHPGGKDAVVDLAEAFLA